MMYMYRCIVLGWGGKDVRCDGKVVCNTWGGVDTKQRIYKTPNTKQPNNKTAK